MRIAELWRYPVKSLAGERVEAVTLTTQGIVGDRIVHVQDARGRVLTARTRHHLLGLHGTLGPDGEPLIDGRPWTAPESAAAVKAAASPDARLVRYEGAERFDVLPLLVATDGAIQRLGVDRRRLRPNIVVEGVEGLAERTWPGRQLRIGPTVIDVVSLRTRCVMTTFDPDTLEQDPSVLRRIARGFGGRMALDCAVVMGGQIAVGDPVELLDGKFSAPEPARPVSQ
jgi:MOSC domain-containing protein